jgi:hypothetical protein
VENETDLPSVIVREVVRQQELMGWPEYVPKYAEFKNGSGKIVFKEHARLTVGDCEQLVEFHSRRANIALKYWREDGSASWRRNAAKSIVYARLYRCRYIQLIGKTDSTEADMPFPITGDP